MTWTVSYDEAGKTVVVKTKGVFDRESMATMRKDIIDAIKEYGARRCLLDHREVTSVKVNTTDIYEMPRAYSESGVPRTLRIAVVVQEPGMEKVKFFETTSRNVGFQVSTFTDVEAANVWLRNEA